jgi:CRISPR/Cas system-associated protein endoribonuclease Cas2
MSLKLNNINKYILNKYILIHKYVIYSQLIRNNKENDLSGLEFLLNNNDLYGNVIVLYKNLDIVGVLYIFMGLLIGGTMSFGGFIIFTS